MYAGGEGDRFVGSFNFNAHFRSLPFPSFPRCTTRLCARDAPLVVSSSLSWRS